MTTTKNPRPRGRPRRFDEAEAVATAQALFHARGYDGVGVAELSTAIGVAPPSLYGAFGSKAGLFARAIDRYATTGGRFITEALAEPDPATLAERLLLGAVESFTAGPDCAGCLAIETARAATEPEVRALALARIEAQREALRARFAPQAGEAAGALADLLLVLLSGLSAGARAGLPPDRLGRAAGMALAGFQVSLATARAAAVQGA